MAVEILCSNKDNHKYRRKDQINNDEECYCEDCYSDLKDKVEELEKENAELEKKVGDLEDTLMDREEKEE